MMGWPKRNPIQCNFRTVFLPAGILGLISLSFLSCAKPPDTSGRVVTDLAGRLVKVPDKVERLIALGPGALRLVVYLGAADLIVGIENLEKQMPRDLYLRPYATVLDEEFLELPVVGTGGPGALPDPETILKCRPDLIVAVTLDPFQLDTIQAKTGVPALYFSYGELGVWRQEALRSLSLLGEALGRSQRADQINQLIADIEKDLTQRTADVAEPDRPSVYIGGVSQKGAHGITSTEGGYLPARMAGAYNLADTFGRSGHFLIDKEQLLAWQPDVIFIDSASRDILNLDFEENREYYRLLRAAASGRTFSLLPYNYYNTNIELALLNAYFIGKTLYPDRFGDVNMQEMAGQIMNTFYGILPTRQIPAFRILRFPSTGPLEWN
jgi:iron complex transport system substrate-binding protein